MVPKSFHLGPRRRRSTFLRRNSFLFQWTLISIGRSVLLSTLAPLPIILITRTFRNTKKGHCKSELHIELNFLSHKTLTASISRYYSPQPFVFGLASDASKEENCKEHLRMAKLWMEASQEKRQRCLTATLRVRYNAFAHTKNSLSRQWMWLRRICLSLCIQFVSNAQQMLLPIRYVG